VSRTLKRVPKTFSWPLKQTWGGYVNPYYALAGECPDCEHGYDRAGGRPDANAALFTNQWYGTAPFDPVAYGAVPISTGDPAIWDKAKWNVERAPEYYMTRDEAYARQEFRRSFMDGFPGDDRPLIPFPVWHRGAAIAREAKRLYEDCFRGHWRYHLIQADVDALVAADQPWELTRRPLTPDQERRLREPGGSLGDHGHWLAEPNGYRWTAVEVNALTRSNAAGIGGNAHFACVSARCKREGVPLSCARCDGSGRIWPTKEIERLRDDWRRTDPPSGDGYQLWENVSEGSPVSPVFESLEDLCAWAADHATTFASFKATADEWRKMLEDDFVHASVGNNLLM
jgi:hypothetical protein